ncbi:hypothetical protein KI688_005990 [Linnemannia hyalina]|uniref:Ion transport domain-containing protein n=1 Tax=Linnemannia hyalina TaxID=64524 RepID=A0A9P7Y5A5_9FUNG|nr:hypothetical protein KI688_005990 [Linnemannia hyalina]
MSEHVIVILDDLAPIPSQQPPQLRTEPPISNLDKLTSSSNNNGARTRWYFRRGGRIADDQEEEEVLEEEGHVDRRELVLAFTIPKSTARETHYDIVLGVSTRDLNLNTVEAIIVTYNRVTGAKNVQSENADLAGKEEPEEGNSEVWKWRLHKKVFLSESALEVAIEVKTRDLGASHYGDDHDDADDECVSVGGASSSTEYGSFGLHFVEIMTGARDYYSKDPRYREHQPFIHCVDINRTGYKFLDSTTAEYPQIISDYCVSKDGSHVVVATTAGRKEGETTFSLQLWNFRDLTAVSPSTPEKAVSLKEEKEGSGSPLVAWMQFPATMKTWNLELVLSLDGSQLVVLDLEPLSLSPDERKNYRTTSTFYRCDINQIEAAEGAVAGSGLVRHYPERIRATAGLEDFHGRAQFHIIAAMGQDIRDEMFITCDGVSVEIYSVYEQWTHVRSILMNPARNRPQFIHNVYSALSKQLRGRYFVVEEPGADQMVSTWDVEQGVRVSSFTGLTPEQKYNISRISAMSSNGQLIVIPGRQHIDLFWTATWTLAGTRAFDSMELTEAIGDVHFIRNDTQIVVGVGVGSDSEEVPFYRKNKGYIINTETMAVVERFVSQGSDVFSFKMGGSWTNPQVYCIGSSQVSLFDLQNRIIQSPTKLRDLCDASCTLVSSFKNSAGRKEVFLPAAGMTFRAEAIMKPIVINGRRETLPFIAVEARDSNGLLIQRMSTPLPREAVFRSARFVGGKDGCSYLLIVLNKWIMVWSTPKSARGGFILRWAQHGESDTTWKICPHSQLYGWKASDDKNNGISNNGGGKQDKDDCLIYDRSIFDPIKEGNPCIFLSGVINLVEIFELATITAVDDDHDALRQDILRYVGKYINCQLSDYHLGSSIVPHICENWTPTKHSAIVLFLRALLLENTHPSVRWVPRPHTVVHGQEEGEGNPILCMINKARTESQAMEVAQVLGEYLLQRARIEKDHYFLVPILRSLQELMVVDKEQPLGMEEFVAQLYRGFAYLPVRPVRLPIGPSDQEQELQWAGTRAGLGLRKDKFSKDLYYASSDMLWYKIDSGSAVTGGGGGGGGGQGSSGNGKMIFSWLGVLWRMIAHNFKLLRKDTVRCYPSAYLECSNPALVALAEYKWGVVGFAYWRRQFMARCCYYILVLLAVALQIYGKSKVGAEGLVVYNWIGVFIDISITSFAVFLCVEVVQMFREGLFSYFRSVFNVADLLVLVLPFAGSLNQLCALMGVLTPPGQNSGFLSFSVLIVLLHFLFELRVFKPVARVVWSTTRGIESIAAFLCVYILGVLGFVMAFMHMIPACPDSASCQNPSSFMSYTPSDFFAAVSGTQLSGRSGWDGGGLFYTDHWANFFLALTFFLFNVIMFINMAIVMIQDASKKGGQDEWKQEWFRHRLQTVESAENMSYKTSADVVYYSATAKEIKEYEKERRNS